MLSLKCVIFCVAGITIGFGSVDYATFIQAMSENGLWNLPPYYQFVNVTDYQKDVALINGGVFGFNFIINEKTCEVKIQQEFQYIGFLMARPSLIPYNIVVEDTCGIHDPSHHKVIGGFLLNFVH